jgi:hypothetical protein
MTLIAIAQQQRAKHLVPRLDACIARIEEGSFVKEHAVMYAAFLTDLAAGRIDAADPEVMGLVALAVEFCTLVESEYPSVH